MIYPNGVHAVKDVSFSVEQGEFLVIIGLSGSGKSTLLRCINRLVEPCGGTVLFKGMEVTALNDSAVRKVRRHIAMVFSEFQFDRKTISIGKCAGGGIGPDIHVAIRDQPFQRRRKTSGT